MKIWINVHSLIPVSLFQTISCKFKKNHLHIISGTSNPSCSPYSGNNQWLKFDVESLSLPEKDTELFYCLVARLLFRSKIARPVIQACVAYIFTRMELPTNNHKDRHLNIDILFVNKTQMFWCYPWKIDVVYVFWDVVF